MAESSLHQSVGAHVRASGKTEGGAVVRDAPVRVGEGGGGGGVHSTQRKNSCVHSLHLRHEPVPGIRCDLTTSLNCVASVACRKGRQRNKRNIANVSTQTKRSNPMHSAGYWYAFIQMMEYVPSPKVYEV